MFSYINTLQTLEVESTGDRRIIGLSLVHIIQTKSTASAGVTALNHGMMSSFKPPRNRLPAASALPGQTRVSETADVEQPARKQNLIQENSIKANQTEQWWTGLSGQSGATDTNNDAHWSVRLNTFPDCPRVTYITSRVRKVRISTLLLHKHFPVGVHSSSSCNGFDGDFKSALAAHSQDNQKMGNCWWFWKCPKDLFFLPHDDISHREGKQLLASDTSLNIQLLLWAGLVLV